MNAFPSIHTDVAMIRRLEKWRCSLTKAQYTEIEGLPLRRDMVTLLTYVRDHKTTGTQSTGNFKLKDIRAMTAQFVNPPVLDHSIGDHTYKLRTEYEVWPLYFLHALADVGSLIEGGPSRIWRLTPNGEKFLDVIPPIQLYLMLMTWFEQVNWLIAYPLEGMGDDLPTGFQAKTLRHLRFLPAGKHVAFEPFADRLIEKTGLTWAAPDSDISRRALRNSIDSMIIRIMADFGILEQEHGKDELGLEVVAAFRLKPWGKGLLKAL